MSYFQVSIWKVQTDVTQRDFLFHLHWDRVNLKHLIFCFIFSFCTWSCQFIAASRFMRVCTAAVGACSCLVAGTAALLARSMLRHSLYPPSGMRLLLRLQLTCVSTKKHVHTYICASIQYGQTWSSNKLLVKFDIFGNITAFSIRFCFQSWEEKWNLWYKAP